LAQVLLITQTISFYLPNNKLSKTFWSAIIDIQVL
jgi:hypothetical protein